jgi:CPA2 family monovalent cation:H+ antiporter-2
VLAHGLLQEIVLVYALAVVLLVVAGRLRLPSIVALIAAGILAGPSGLALVPVQEDVEMLSEIGVALLLFMAGLDFSIGELRRIWRRVLVGGIGQVALTVLLAAGAALMLGVVSVPHLFVLGLFVALSSTAIVLKELTRLNQAHAPHGRLTIGVLLLQDLIVIAVLVFAPIILGTGAAMSPGVALLRVALVLAGVFLVGRFVLPWLLRIVSAASREAFPLAVLLASLGTALLTSMLGLSMAVGAFLAGLLLAESEFSHQIHAEVRPLRDLLASLFFISVGMLVDPLQMSSALPTLVALAVALMVVKAAGAAGAFVLAGAPQRVAVASAVALAQIGEFSFILGRSALEAGVFTRGEWQLLLGASILTMAATPSLVAVAPGLGSRFGRRRAAREVPGTPLPSLAGHVVILGYGVGGRLIARALSELATPYLILELNGDTVQSARAAGEPIYYGDATVQERLEAAGVRRAVGVVALLSDPDASRLATRAVRSLSATVPLIVRTRYRLEAERLMEEGATLAIAEELEASLEVLAQLLARMHIPGNVIEVLLDTYRRTTTAAGKRSRSAPAVPLGDLPLEIVDTPVATFRLANGMWGAGRTLKELNLRAETGATVLAVRRGQRTLTSPDGEFRLEIGDDLYLLGDDADIRLARNRLQQGPRQTEPKTV